CRDFVFAILAVSREYVDRLTCWFVFGPILVAFVIGIMVFIYLLKSPHDNFDDLIEKDTLKSLALITLAFICFTMEDISLKLHHKIKAGEPVNTETASEPVNTDTASET
ncbi:1056_t:CDS:2, partial [Paraglomus occultum]